MALTTTKAAQIADDARTYPIDKHGKLRYCWATWTQGAAAGDDGSVLEGPILPQGRLRIIPWLSRYKSSAFGASRVMKFGHRVYSDKFTGTIAEDDDALFAAIDISAAVVAFFPLVVGEQMAFDMYSVSEKTMFVTVTGGTIPAAATLEMALAYIYE